MVTRSTDAIFGIGMALLCVGPACADRLVHIGTFDWPSKSVFGLSGFEVGQDGTTYHAISDQGWYLVGRLWRENGVIADVTIDQFLPILGQDGLPVAARRVGDWSDAEGLAVAADGTHWISFERWSRVSRFAGPGQVAEWIKDHPEFYDYEENRQLEALALHPDGRLYTFPEQPLERGFPIYVLNPGAKIWVVKGQIAELEGFAIVGADFDAQGRLYLLERKLVLGLWWQSRIRRVLIDAPDEIELLWTSTRGTHYNLEGIAIWEDSAGLRITMVSDDNGDRSQPTQIVEYQLVQDDP